MLNTNKLSAKYRYFKVKVGSKAVFVHAINTYGKIEVEIPLFLGAF